MARLGPRTSFQTASSLASDGDSQVDFITLGFDRPNSPSSGTALSTHAETQVCHVQLLEEEDVHVHVNILEPKDPAEVRRMLVTRSTETQTEGLLSGTRSESTQTEEPTGGWTPADDAGAAHAALPTVAESPASHEAMPSAPYLPDEAAPQEADVEGTVDKAPLGEAEAAEMRFQESADEVAGCTATYPDESAKEEATFEEGEFGLEGQETFEEGQGGGDGADATALTSAEEGTMLADDEASQAALASHVEDTAAANDQSIQDALATHVGDTAEANDEATQEALASHVEDTAQANDEAAHEALAEHVRKTSETHDEAAQAALASHMENTAEANDEVVGGALASHVEESALANDATVSQALDKSLRLLQPHWNLASHMEDAGLVGEQTMHDAPALFAEELGGEEASGHEVGEEKAEARKASTGSLSLSDAPSPKAEHNREVAPQEDTEDEQLEAWRLRVQLMMLQEAAASYIPAKMSPRELVRTLGMVMSERTSSLAQASPKDMTQLNSSRSHDSLLAEGLMTPPSPPAPSSARSPSETSARPLWRSKPTDEREAKKRIHPVPPLDFSRVYMGDGDIDIDYEGADSTWMTHGRSISPTVSSSQLSKSTSDSKLFSRPSLLAPEIVKREATPEEKYQKFMNKIRAKHLLPPRVSPFAKPQVLAPIAYKPGSAFGMKKKKETSSRLPTPFMEQLHSHFHHHFHFRNNLPPISHGVDFETGACLTDSQ